MTLRGLLHRRRRAETSMLIAMGVFLVLVIPALFGDRLAPHEPTYFVVEHGNDPRPYDPGIVFPFGSDVLGRDLVSLVIAGAPATLQIVLLAGLSRVVAGVLIATIGSWWRPVGLLAEWLGELVSSIPATIVALLVVKVLVKADTTIYLFIAALLVTGWTGPYRVIRAEVDRLARASFTEGAVAIGVGRWRLFWRHTVPHLVPALAINLTQQMVASLVLIAELGVLGTFVGRSRTVNIEESLSRVITGPVNVAQISDPPEWGGLLASARTIESLWTTRWLVLVPGLAFALAAASISVLGITLARRYAHRDVYADVRSSRAAILATLTIALVVLSIVLPDRYAAATEWAASARAAVEPTSDVEGAFVGAGLAPIGPTFAVTHRVTSVNQTGPATVRAGALEFSERFPEPLTDVSDRGRNIRAYLSTGGGAVEAPLVFAGRGITFDDYVPDPPSVALFGRNEPGFAKLIRDFHYGDDFAQIDVRGKIVLLVRFLGIRGPVTAAFNRGYAEGSYPTTAIDNAIKRGAVGVIFIDPALWLYNDIQGCCTYALGELVGGTNPYSRAAQQNPPHAAKGVPVVVLSEEPGRALGEQYGIDLAQYFRFDERGGDRYTQSPSRDLPGTAHINVPLAVETATTTSYVAEVPGVAATAPRILLWSIRQRAAHPAADVLVALARTLADRHAPFVLVDFDPSVDAHESAQVIRELLGTRSIALVVVLNRLDGPELELTTPYGNLTPALEQYAEKAGARLRPALTTPGMVELAGGVAPFIDLRTVVINSPFASGDVRGDAAAFLGYLAARFTLGAEELPR